jgi:hypothetical protein
VTAQTTEQTRGSQDAQHEALSKKETRDIITPYAFHVPPALFGTPLARPIKRGAAFCIDIALVGILSQASSLLLAAVAAITFFRAGNRLKEKQGYNVGRIFLRLFSAVLLFILAAAALDVVQEIIDANDDNDKVRQELVEKGADGNLQVKDLKSVEGLALIGLTAKYMLKTKDVGDNIADGSCSNALPCWRELGQDLAEDLASLGLGEEDVEPVFEQLLEQASDTLTPNEVAKLETLLLQTFAQNKSSANANLIESLPEAGLTLSDPDALEPPIVDDKSGVKSPQSELVDKLAQIEPAEKRLASEKPSLIDWAQGLASDMGLGLGWAAVYFSVFTARWRGQTPGKRLLGIRVIKLDGSSLNLWESFGRYGGYGAGLATGLLGFIQIYWDPNRQAIQDKISETLVIDLRRDKVPFMQSQQMDQ